MVGVIVVLEDRVVTRGSGVKRLSSLADDMLVVMCYGEKLREA
jgi:hypothetical protein